MEWVETTGRTIDEAKDAALDQLGVDEQDAEFEILEEARVGLFGRIRNEARVRARVRPTAPRPKEDRRDRRRQRARSGGSGGSRGDGSGGRGGSAGGDSGGQPSGGKPAGSSEPGGRTETAILATERAAGRRRPRRRRSSSSSGSSSSSSSGGETAQGRDSNESNEEGSAMSMPLAEQGARAQEFLEGLVEQFGIEPRFAVVELDEDTVEVRIEGDGLGLLIGPKGQTLAALQELARCALQQSGGRGRLLVDVGGYRQKRKEALERFTQQVANEVLTSGARRALEPMSAADRKIVHDTVNEIAGVRTTSEGEEPRRRVIIWPEAENEDA